jgi:hypothetical protein
VRGKIPGCGYAIHFRPDVAVTRIGGRQGLRQEKEEEEEIKVTPRQIKSTIIDSFILRSFPSPKIKPTFPLIPPNFIILA